MREKVTLLLLIMFLMNAVPSVSNASDAKAIDSRNTEQNSSTPKTSKINENKASVGPTTANNVEKTAKVIIVSKTGGDSKTITAALTAITEASSTNPYVINVMPGIYEESIKMKPYVDVIGSGQNDTKITSSSYATVIGADNSRIENIWIDSTGATSSNGYNPSAILNDGTSMTINNVKVTMNDPADPLTPGPAMDAFGIQMIAKAKNVISNCTVYGRGTKQRSIIGIGELSGDSSPAINNCNIAIDTSGATYSFWNVGVRLDKGSVKNSVIKVTGADYNEGISTNVSRRNLHVLDTKVEAIGTSNTINNIGITRSLVANSEIIVGGTAKGTNCAVSGDSVVEKSLIDGPICSKESRIFKCWDKKNNPIPNQ